MDEERWEFLCPISMTVMEDPVILVETAVSYERREITAWFARGNNTCPCTGITLQSQVVIPNRALKEAITNSKTQKLSKRSTSVSRSETSSRGWTWLGLGWFFNCCRVDSEETRAPDRRQKTVSKNPRDVITRMTQAVHRNDLKTLTTLYSEGWNFNVLDISGRSPLHVAVIDNNHTLIVHLLQDFGLDVNFGDRQGYTALHWASRLGHTEIVKSLIDDFHANVNSRNKTQMTPLHMAAYWGRQEVIVLLLQRGADLQAMNYKHETAIDVASKSPLEAAKHLIPILESSS